MIGPRTSAVNFVATAIPSNTAHPPMFAASKRLAARQRK